MMMMMKIMLLMMTLDRKNMIQVRVSDRKGKEIDQSSMLKPSIYTVTEGGAANVLRWDWDDWELCK